MRSGNGRHRRPRQAPALLVTAGVTGAGIAIPLLGAGGAQAADAGTWDRVAACESGGLWSANKGNGYYGGLQLTQETWEQYGGKEYADRADLASRGQQITVAEKILDEEGPEAWGCADEAGLTEDSAQKPDVDPGDLDVPAPERPAPSEPGGTDSSDGTGGSGSNGSSGAADESGDSAAPSPAPSEPSGRPSTTPTPTPSPDSPDSGKGDKGEETGDGTGSPPAPAEGSGKHRGGDDAGRADKGDRGDGDRSSRGGGRHGREGEDEGPAAGSGGTYTVRTGDSLSRIAAEHGVDGGWSALYEDNRDVVGTDADLIRPGQELAL